MIPLAITVESVDIVRVKFTDGQERLFRIPGQALQYAKLLSQIWLSNTPPDEPHIVQA